MSSDLAGRIKSAKWRKAAPGKMSRLEIATWIIIGIGFAICIIKGAMDVPRG